MDSWMGLLKKDFLLMKNRFLVFLMLDLLAFGLGWYLHIKEIGFLNNPSLNWVMNENDFIKLIPLAIAIGLHVLFISFYVFMSLRKEGKQLHLWLHNPQSAYVLLGSKVVNGLIALIISLIFSFFLFFMYFLPILSELGPHIGDLTKLIMYASTNIIFASLVIGSAILFFWVLYHVFKSRIGKWSLLVILIVMILFIWGMSNFQATDIYNNLVLRGEINIEFPSFEALNFVESNVMDVDQGEDFVGLYVFNVLIFAVLFVLSAWMIEKKVEV
ncbi:hypothetical protein [Chengkuizengella axinellae]|uniref:ABC transporter permease n=1 Tax=Chengkuizengella axinellae TaxID=3064388 RepID=A0ABT9IWZ7_9BACL|nr:hypothetical protein [Chengkuizengella sp. 2205SS18-9]MDP5273896.1 hypothetical protein [Chengkuizengella sp. 2205SS18-9]